MQKESEIAKLIRDMANDDVHRSEAARLRDLVDEIEVAIQAGVSHASIHKILLTHGFTMQLNSFTTMLGRIRKRRRTKPATHAGNSEQSHRLPSVEASTEKDAPENFGPGEIAKIVKGTPDLDSYKRIARSKRP